MPLILYIAKQYKLDTRDLKAEHFIVAREDEKLLGFGRLKYHKEFTEVGTFAVLPAHRHKGIGRKIMNRLIQMAAGEVYLMTTIPEYAYRFGFRLVKAVPAFIWPELIPCVEAHYPDTVILLSRKPIQDITKPDKNHITG